MRAFADAFPERFVELGVAEQNLAGVAAGMALAGKIPFAASYGCFHPANSWGVIRTSIAYSNLNVKLVGGHTGLVTGEDGATHQSLEDRSHHPAWLFRPDHESAHHYLVRLALNRVA